MYQTGKYSVAADAAEFRKALSLARGTYQEAILWGTHAMSGATLKGKAKAWGASYARSVGGLKRRLSAAGVRWSERIGDHNRRILVIGIN